MENFVADTLSAPNTPDMNALLDAYRKRSAELEAVADPNDPASEPVQGNLLEKKQEQEWSQQDSFLKEHIMIVAAVGLALVLLLAGVLRARLAARRKGRQELDMIETSIELLYAVTVALKGPVVVGILLALGWSLFETGAFLHEMIERRRHGAPWRSEAVAFRTVKKEKPVTDLLSSENAPDIAKAVMETARENEGPADRSGRSSGRRGVRGGQATDAAADRVAHRSGHRLDGHPDPDGAGPDEHLQGGLGGNVPRSRHRFQYHGGGLAGGSVVLRDGQCSAGWYARDLADIERLFHGSGEGGR